MNNDSDRRQFLGAAFAVLVATQLDGLSLAQAKGSTTSSPAVNATNANVNNHAGNSS
jgi:hypothetical protein